MNDFELGIRRGPEGIRRSNAEEGIKMPLADIEKELSWKAGRKESQPENSQEQLDYPRLERLPEKERREAFEIIVPKIVSLVKEVKDRLVLEGMELNESTIQADLGDSDLEKLKHIFDIEEIVQMFRMKDQSLSVHVETELGIKLLREEEEVARTAEENSGKLHSALHNIRETYNRLGVPIKKENPPAEMVRECGSLFVNSLKENELTVPAEETVKGEYLPHIGKVVVRLEDSSKKELSQEELSAFQFGTIQSKSFQKVMFGGGESHPAKLSDLKKVQEMQLGFSQWEKVAGEMKVIYKNLDIGVTELLTRLSSSSEAVNSLKQNNYE